MTTGEAGPTVDPCYVVYFFRGFKSFPFVIIFGLVVRSAPFSSSYPSQNTDMFLSSVIDVSRRPIFVNRGIPLGLFFGVQTGQHRDRFGGRRRHRPSTGSGSGELEMSSLVESKINQLMSF